MASTTKQQNYRRLMKEAKVKSSSQPKKIDHPLARYNALDQLSCIVCQQAIKSELLWSTHLKSRRHKETMTELKNKKDVLLQQQKTAVIIGRGEKGGGGGEEEEGQADDRATVTNPPTPPPLVSVLKKTMREPSSHSDPGTSSDTDDQPPAKKHKVTFSDAVVVETTSVEKSSVDVVAENSAAAVENSSLPADFFDPGVSKRLGEDGDDSDGGEDGRSGGTVKMDANSKPLGKSSAGETSQPNSKSSENLQETAIPEGFFDDPKMDAKARKVEYKDKMEEEWERFQKTIQKENDVSNPLFNDTS
ncbi:Zinc finger protein 830 [Geodia barretti]|uniref:Zinc finger protein 830 n=1 Tax=Geodia barretti TaxID=519541 RepID=A0AA35RTY7_GEOBA|nr:Zinc finger protein 830 [Geodia barretti]